MRRKKAAKPRSGLRPIKIERSPEEPKKEWHEINIEKQPPEESKGEWHPVNIETSPEVKSQARRQPRRLKRP